jgi:signal transduction histidine kinase
MPFLMEHGSSELGVYICVSMLFAISVWSIGSGDSRIYIIPACFVFLSGMILWFGWRNRMTTEYMKRVKEKEIASLNETISQQNTQLQCVKRENEELSKIIHKDNKLLPALELAVREYLVSAVSGEASVSDAEAILQTIEQASQERVGIVKSYERQHKIIPKTNIQSLDMMFSYLQRKAESVDADFDLTITGNVSDLPVQQDMDEQDLRTILADLIENAILSEKNTFRRETLVNFYVSDLISFIDVFDSGIPFEASTLANIGVKPASTHLHERGSGIGLMNSFALCKKYDISLEITEFSQDSLFSKKVSLCFDRLGEYRISTPREAAIKALTQREDIRFF